MKKTKQKTELPKLIDIIFMVKKNTYLNKYMEGFVSRHLDALVKILEKVLVSRGRTTEGKWYCEFVPRESKPQTTTGEGTPTKSIERAPGTPKFPQKKDDFHLFSAAIGVTEQDIYRFNTGKEEEKERLVPALVDVLRGLWWSIRNNKEMLTDNEGFVADRSNLDKRGDLRMKKAIDKALKEFEKKQEQEKETLTK